VGKSNPHEVTRQYAALCKNYHVREVVGDAYSAQWVAGAWREAGVNYRKSPLTKSDIYLECIPLFTRGLVRLPDHPKLLRELRLLERRTHRSGKDSVDHPRGQRDDFSNSCCGALHLVGRIAARSAPKPVSPGVFSNGRWWSDGQGGTLPPPGYQRTHEPWRDFVGPDAVYSHWPGSGPREW
jgi:hypothetical protein